MNNYLAQVNISGLQSSIGGNAFSNLGGVIGEIIPYILAAAGFLLVIYLVVGGLQYVFSFGDPKKVAAAQGKITTALIGFLVVFLSYTLVRIVGLILSIEAVKDIFK